MIKSYIVVKLQVEGIHRWPAAGDHFPEVEYLSHPHRHIFHIECKKEVFHDDRDVEFILFKREINEYLHRKYFNKKFKYQMCDFKSMSCEMIARELLEQFELVSCSVFEDGENGAECSLI